MEKIWNNRRIRLLLSADPDTIEEFLQTYSPVIYTRMYYQVGADAEIALDLTAQTLSKAIENLLAFDPTKETLFQWLKERARQSRDEGLHQRQIKPQRPWAWSQLPDDVLCGLARFRVDFLNDKILSNPFVHEIVQASLSELELRDRELLIHRFCHLDSEEHIAEEMGCSIEDIQNWLYRSRHSFRRVFFQIISSINPGFAESSDSGELEIQDTNLEKLLSTTTINLPLKDNQIVMIRTQLLQVAEETSQKLPEESSGSKILLTGIAIISIILIISLIYWVSKNNATEVPSPVPTVVEKSQELSEQENIKSPKTQPIEDDIDGEDLKVIFALGQAGDVEALLEILKSGQFTSQIAAAHFLGKLADPNAIELLEQAEAHWYPEPTDDNAFAKAIAEILTRFPNAVQVIDTAVQEEQEIQATQQPDIPKEAQDTPSSIPNLTGIVSDFMDQPTEGTGVKVTRRMLFSNIDTGAESATTKTDSKGRYQFTDIAEGPAVLTSKIGQDNETTVTRSLWCRKDSISIVNIGGKPVLTGTVVVDGKPLANQKLFLSDTLDITNASFSQENQTDTEGNFSFLGVLPDVYSLLYKGLDNRMHRLGIIEMPQQEISNVTLNLQSVTAILDYPAEPNQPMPAKTVLAYTMDIPDDFYQAQAQASDDGTMLFKGILPGSYVLKVLLDNGVWIQQEVEIVDGVEDQIFVIDPVSTQTAILSGRFLNPSPIDLFLINPNQQIHIDIKPNAEGNYEHPSVPMDVYSLAAFVNGQLIEFLQIDLQEESELTLDIDPAEILSFFSPLYAVVVDPKGLIVSGAQIWLTNGQQVDTTSSTGQGAFLATTPGNYTLSVALPGYPTIERQVKLKESTLLAKPNTNNTLLIHLESPAR